MPTPSNMGITTSPGGTAGQRQPAKQRPNRRQSLISVNSAPPPAPAPMTGGNPGMSPAGLQGAPSVGAPAPSLGAKPGLPPPGTEQITGMQIGRGPMLTGPQSASPLSQIPPPPMAQGSVYGGGGQPVANFGGNQLLQNLMRMMGGRG